MLSDKTIILSKGQWTTLEIGHFFHATSGAAQPAYPTQVQLKADADFLHLSFHCENDHFVSENHLREHNQPLYNQEVFELFIAPDEADPAQYLEVEINPNDALWVGKIDNPSLGVGDGMKAELLAPEPTGILHGVTKGDSSWSGVLSVPWALIGVGENGRYRLNFYRIVATQSHPNPDWTCDLQTCDFLCWSPTLSGAAPAFHRPKQFGLLWVQD